MTPPGQTQVRISDLSLIPWFHQKAIRFSVALSVGDRDGDLYIVQQGCLAWRNRFNEIEWSLPVYNTKGSRIRRYAGWVSPRLYVEVQRFLEERFGHRLKWAKRPVKQKEILNLNEGEEVIEFAPSGGPRSTGPGVPEMEGSGEQEDQGNDATPATPAGSEDPYGIDYHGE